MIQEGTTSWKRVVEETQVSNTTILTGLVTTSAAVVAGIFYRDTLKKILKQNIVKL